MSATLESPVAPAALPVQEANTFSLSGHGIHVDFFATSLTGQPQLTYHDTAQTRSFSGNEIRRVDVADLGTVVSVTLSIVPDVGSTTFSVLIPHVSVVAGVPSQVTTDAITTIHRTPLIGRFVGQRELYRVTQLKGTASFLVF